MKKVILSITVITAMLIATNIQKVHAIGEQPAVTMILGDDGFVDVQLQELSEAVQASISAFTQEYDIKALRYNAEKQLTKVELVKKDDQSVKTLFLDAEGKEVECPVQAGESEKSEEESPSIGSPDAMQANGFVNIKFDELNEKVQNAVRNIAGNYDITSIKYNVEQKITKVKGISKEDQSEKVFFLNEEGEEIEQPAAPQEQKQEETKEIPTSL